MADVAKKRTKPLEVGTEAPDFTASTHDGRTVRLSDYKGQVVVLYFYVRDNTSICTTEACGFRDEYDSFKKEGVAVLGISPDSAESHRKFHQEHRLPFTLVADEDQAIAEAYGVRREKTDDTPTGVARTTFVIDRDGKIAQVFENVDAQGHETQVLDWIRTNLK